MKLTDVMTQQNTICGAGTMFKGTGLARDPDRIPTGVFPVDFITAGGIPIWGSTCYWGPECLAGNSVVTCMTATNGKRHSNKKVTLSRLYGRFHDLPGKGQGQYIRKESKHADYFVTAVDENNRVFQNRILNVVLTGKKQCYELTTKGGFALVSTMKHQYKTEGQLFKELSDLSVGDKVYIHNNTRVKGQKRYGNRKEVSVKNYSRWPVNIVNGCTYYRQKVSRVMYEAAMNKMTYEEFIFLLNNPGEYNLFKLWSIPDGYEIHHKDFKWWNNDLQNLEMLPYTEHGRLHALQNIGKLSFIAVLDEIVSIVPKGEYVTYDIQCEYPYNNYIANGIVVHNSGAKTTLGIHTVKTSQDICFRCFNHKDRCTCSKSSLLMRAVWGDSEGTLDRTWASCIGADPEKYIVVLADYGEQHINIADSALMADDCGLYVMDSLASLVPSAELEAASEDQFIALQARLIGRAVRKLKQRLIKERKNGHPCAILFTNQLRINIKQTFGDPESMSGGKAMMHEFSLLLRCNQKVLKKEGADKKFRDDKRKKNYASRHIVSVRKFKILTLAGVCEYVRMIEDHDGLTAGQVSDFNSMMSQAKEYGIVKKAGSKWLYFKKKTDKLGNIINVWQKHEAERIRTMRAIVGAAKLRIMGG